MGVGGQRHARAALPPGKIPGTHFTGGWVKPRAGVDGCGKSRPHRDSLYRLSYRGPPLVSDTTPNSVQRRRFIDSYVPQNDYAVWHKAEVIIVSFSGNCVTSFVSETPATFIKVAGSSETLVFNYSEDLHNS